MWGKAGAVRNGGILNIENGGAIMDLNVSTQSTVNNSGYVGTRYEDREPDAGAVYVMGQSTFNNNVDGQVRAKTFQITGNSVLNNYGQMYVNNVDNLTNYNGIGIGDATVNNYSTINKVRLNSVDSVLTGIFDSHIENVRVQHVATLDTGLYQGTIDQLTVFGNLDFHINSLDDFTTLRADNLSLQGTFYSINLHFADSFFSSDLIEPLVQRASRMDLQSTVPDLYEFDLKQLFLTLDGGQYDDAWFSTYASKFQLVASDGWELVSTGLDGTSIQFLRQEAPATPEPATVTIFVLGCAGLAFTARRKKKSS